MITIKHHGPEFRRRLFTKQKKSLQLAGAVLSRNMQRKVSVPVKIVGGKVVERSKPGEPPRLETGFGRASIMHESDVNRGRPLERVGLLGNARYMFYLELGTQKVAPRPWLHKTVIESMPAIQEMIAGLGLGELE